MTFKTNKKCNDFLKQTKNNIQNKFKKIKQ